MGAWNPIGGMGVMMFGPTLLEYGTEAQKIRHIPPIARGRGALVPGLLRAGRGIGPRFVGHAMRGQGRSLAGQRPEDLDQWRAVGRLVLLPGADRHNQEARRHQLPSDRHALAGIEVRPIRLISGNSPFCETFFTDVEVPKENLVGPLGGGWSIAKRLLQHERAGLTGAGGSGRAAGFAGPVSRLAKTAHRPGRRRAPGRCRPARSDRGP